MDEYSVRGGVAVVILGAFIALVPTWSVLAKVTYGRVGENASPLVRLISAAGFGERLCLLLALTFVLVGVIWIVVGLRRRF